MSNIDVKSLIKATEMSLKAPTKAEPTKHEKCLVYWVLEKKTTIIPADFISDKTMRKQGAHTKARFRKGGKTYPVKVIHVSDDMKSLEEMQSSVCKDLVSEEGGGDDPGASKGKVGDGTGASKGKESSSETKESSNKKCTFKAQKKRKDDTASKSPKKMKKKESGGLGSSKETMKVKAEAAKKICGEIIGSQILKKVDPLPKAITQDYSTGTLEPWTNDSKWTSAAQDHTWQESSCLELLQSDVKMPYQQFDEQLAQVTAERDQALLRVQHLERELEETKNRMPFQAATPKKIAFLRSIVDLFAEQSSSGTTLIHGQSSTWSSETSLPGTRRKLPFIPLAQDNTTYPTTPSTNHFTIQETSETYLNNSPFPQQHLYSQSYTDISTPQQTQFTSQFYNEPQTQISSHSTFQDTTPSDIQLTATPFSPNQSLPVHAHSFQDTTPSHTQLTATTFSPNQSLPVHAHSFQDTTPSHTQLTATTFSPNQSLPVHAQSFQDTTPSHTQLTATTFSPNQSLPVHAQSFQDTTPSHTQLTATTFSPSQIQPIQSPLQSSVNSAWSSPITKNGDKKIELAENTGVYITKSQHAQLTMHGYANPRKVLLRLLEMLVDQRTLAVSSALGSRSAVNKKGEQSLQTTPIQNEIKSGISAYLGKHCAKGEELTKTLRDINSIINSKCGTARRYLKQ